MVLQLLSALCALKKPLDLLGPGMPSHSKQTLWKSPGFPHPDATTEMLCFSNMSNTVVRLLNSHKGKQTVRIPCLPHFPSKRLAFLSAEAGRKLAFVCASETCTECNSWDFKSLLKMYLRWLKTDWQLDRIQKQRKQIPGQVCTG